MTVRRSFAARTSRRAVSTRGKAAPRRRTLRLESLEPRQLLAADLASLGEVREKLAKYVADGEVRGLTVITHGYQLAQSDGDSLRELATAIRDRADAENGNQAGAWLLDYEVTGEAGTDGFDFHSGQSICTGTPDEVVLLYDWAAESNEPSAGWGEAAGDSLFATLVGLDLLDPQTPSANPSLHLIGHSFGSAVTSELTERLAYYHVPVDQLTYLDPHDFAQTVLPVDGAQQLSTLGQPNGYGATVWNNVAFADVYYQTFIPPDGRPIPGAYNELVNSFPVGAFPHSYIWSGLYRDSVLDTSSTTGYAFSRVAGGAGLRPAEVFANSAGHPQDHQHTDSRLDPASVSPLYRAAPDWTPWSLYNGDFRFGGDEWDSYPPLGNNLVPGWSQHGGGGSGQLAKAGGNFDLLLTPTASQRTHNLSYVDDDATAMVFKLQWAQADASDAVEVLCNGVSLRQFPLSTASGSKDAVVPIPSSLRGAAATITLRLVGGSDSIHATAHVDDVHWERGGQSGDVLPVNLQSLTPGSTFDREQLQLELVQADGTALPLTVEVNALRKDWKLLRDGETVGYILFSDRVVGRDSPF